MHINRRHFFGQGGSIVGAAALGALLGESATAEPILKHIPQFAPRAKRVISLFMSGGPSHVDLFDPKPLLNKRDGEPMP